MMHRSAPRVLILSESPEGFGHFNVTDQLSAYLKVQGAEVGLATGSLEHAHSSFNFASATPFPLPGVYSACPEPYDIATGKPYDGAFITRRKERMHAICESFKPDIIVSELYPFKDPYREHDIEACRDWMKQQRRAVPVVTLCRDLIRANNPEQVLDQLSRQVDAVLVRGDGKFGTLEDSMPEWKHITCPIRYTGNIISPMPPRQHPPSANDPVVVFGGGGYMHTPEFDFFATSIRSRAHAAGALAKAPWDIYVSQHCPAEDFEALQALAQRCAPDGAIHVKRVVAHSTFQQALSDCAAAITRGGYNTCFELASLQKPFVVVPRAFEFSDQTPRAHLMAEAGHCRTLEQHAATPAALGMALAAQHAGPPPTTPLDHSGLSGAGDAVLEIARTARRRPLKGTLRADTAPATDRHRERNSSDSATHSL